jgi:hypothetical protein
VNNLVHISYNYCKETYITEGGSSSPLRTPFNTACPLKTRKMLLSASKLSAFNTEPNLGNTCYNAGRNLCLPVYYPKLFINVKIKYTKL